MTVILAITTILNMSYWLLFLTIIIVTKKKPKSDKLFPVSILVCFKNEEENISKLIPSLASQCGNPPIVFMDDFSTDKTYTLLQKAAQSNQNIKLYKCNIDSKGKKAAILEGFEKTTTSLVINTDADCEPVSSFWVESMSKFSEGENVVLGYAPYFKGAGLLNAWIRFETFLIALQYFSFAKFGFGFMGVGRNTLIPLHLVKNINLNDLQPDIASGDDDFIFQKISTRSNTKINLDPDSFVYSKAKDTWGAYLQQKNRHISAAPYYSFVKAWMLHLFNLSQFLFFSFCILALFFMNPMILLNILIARWLFLYFVTYYSAKKLAIQDLWKWIPVFDVMLYFFYFIFAIQYTFSKNQDFETTR